MWKKIGDIAVGGLREVGYNNNEEYLVVLSSNGRGIFSCKTGQKVARDYDDYYMEKYDSDNGIVEGFDCLKGEKIVCCGLEFEDFLKKETSDGWKVVKNPPEPDDSPFERYNVEKIYLLNKSGNQIIYTTKISVCELRTYGFSTNGMTFIVATSCSLEIWNRSNK